MLRIQGDQGFTSGGHEGSVAIHASTSSSSPDLTRVFVQLTNGLKIAASVPKSSTVHGLHAQALQLAAKLGVNGTLDNTVLQTTGKPFFLLREQSLIEALHLTEDVTFFLASLDNPKATAVAANREVTAPNFGAASSQSDSRPSTFHGLLPPQLRRDPKIYIRWITLDSALDHSLLQRIPVDKAPLSCDTTLSEFHRIAVERLCGTSPRGSCLLPQKLNLFLRECCLHAENNLATLKDLGLRGGKHEPLDVFVVFTGLEARKSLGQLSSSTDPKRLWSFDSTNRGMSTFVVSMQMLLKEIERGHCTLDGILEVLLEVTHFPPLLLAFRSVHEIGIDSRTDVGSLLLIASAFQELGRKIVPNKFCASPDRLLEASRQILFWIYSMRSEASLSRGSSRPLVHRAQIMTSSDSSQHMPAFMPFNEVDVSSGSNPGSKTYLVSTETGGRALSQRLGIAFHENSSLPWDFYFQPVEGWNILWNQRVRPTPNQNEFESLVETTNLMDAFRMVGPMQIGACLAAELPVITLSSGGFISKYDHEDLECSQRNFVTWNPIEGRENLPDNPGQFLAQKLDPIIVDRKKLGNWGLDAWPEWTKTADYGPPDEAIVICVDVSPSMRHPMPTGWMADQSSGGLNPSRLTEVKEFFKNLALRISALNLSTHLGLVTFADRSMVKIKQPLTALHLDFNHQLDDMEVGRSTAIYDALTKANYMFAGIKSQYPNTKCRIILLTDGDDNNSIIHPSTVSIMLYDNNIVLDAVVIATPCTSELFKMAKHTGGYAFSPQTQQALFQIFLLETVVDIRTRPNIARGSWEDWYKFQPKPADMANPYEFPPCNPHPNIEDYFIALDDAERFMNRMSRGSTRRSTGSSASVHSSSTGLSLASTVTVGAGGNSRVWLSEIKAMIHNPHNYMDIYVSQSNMCFWKVVMQGPPDSPYAHGTFLLFVEMGPEFPRRPPSARFITPMLHPNITKHGRVCHPIFDREWTPATRIYQVLQQLYGILMSIEARDVVDPLSTLRFWSNEEEGSREVENYVKHFASSSRGLHRLYIVGNDACSATSSLVSSSVSTDSCSTATLPSFHSRDGGGSQKLGQNPFSSPPSYRTRNSVSGTSIRSASTASTLFSHFAILRRPPQGRPEPPPFIASQEISAAGSTSQSGRESRNRLSRVAGVTSSSVRTVNAEGNGDEPDGSQISSAAGGRRLSRRASFFALLRNARTSPT